jgi:beta-glucanase (GH16 family)
MQNRVYLTATILLAVSVCACTDTRSTTTKQDDVPKEKDGWTLVWNDEFDYTGLPNSSKWSYDTEGNAWKWGNNEAQWYTEGMEENACVEDGVLKITAIRKDMNGAKYTSARLRSKGKGDWKYGRFEIKAKLPSGIGTWPAIWMLPSADVYGGWPASGEIDIMENVGYDPDTISAAAHTKTYNHAIGTGVSARIGCPTCHTEFHIYTLEWEEKEYRVYLDDALFFTYKNDGTGFAAYPFDQSFHLLLNVAIGGNWGGQHGIDDSSFPHTMEVDYVRVYQRL